VSNKKDLLQEDISVFEELLAGIGTTDTENEQWAQVQIRKQLEIKRRQLASLLEQEIV